ncbi:MAG: ABC transporter ATP-binding protein [Clostridiaceae bacterium]|nr:ABC transporter ATP-binding protein [Clostridiaceae bacterium]
MLLKHAKKYLKWIVGQLFFATVWVASQLAIPRLMVDIIDYGIFFEDMSQIMNRGLLMLLATGVNIVSLLISLFFLTRVTAGISRDLRGDLFEKIIDWSKETRGSFSNSTLITRTVNDVKQVSILIDMSLRKIYTLTITVIGAVIISFSIDVKMAAIILVIIPVIFVLALRLTTKAMPKYSRIRKAIDQMNQRFRENVTGIRVVKAFNKSDYETKMFQETTKEACQANVQAESTMMLLSPLILLFTNVLILIMLYVGGVRAELGTVTVGALIGLIEYAIMALNNIQQFASIITIFPRSKVSIDRIQEVLAKEEVLQIRDKAIQVKEKELEIKEKPQIKEETQIEENSDSTGKITENAIRFKDVANSDFAEKSHEKANRFEDEANSDLTEKLTENATRFKDEANSDVTEKSTENAIRFKDVATSVLAENTIRFENVDFCYPPSCMGLLKNITFELQKGEIKAMIGSTGSGKSTIVRLMMRDYDVRQGQITCNGENIESLTNEEINQIITYIPQTTFLFSGTIRENIQTGKKDATDDEVWEVLEMVQMGDFFRQSEEGLDFHIAQNAVNLSGGQKQRISIARGLIRESDFYIFDDCFSALDYSTEKKVRQAIQEKLSGKGILVIAQRVATVKEADEILVIDNGNIVGKGSHQELENTCKVYQEIITSQKSLNEENRKTDEQLESV